MRAQGLSTKLFDVIDRLSIPTEGRNYPHPLYHADRYYYHQYPLLFENKRVVIFLTDAPLDFMDLIKVRSVPIGFVGVTFETIFADRHYQSPLDFFIHDINHVRRMQAYSDIIVNNSMSESETLITSSSF